MKPDPRKNVLKQALKGKVTSNEMQQTLAQATGEFIPVMQRSPCVYNVGEGLNGLTEQEMKSATLGKGNIPFILTIRRSHLPDSSS